MTSANTGAWSIGHGLNRRRFILGAGIGTIVIHTAGCGGESNGGWIEANDEVPISNLALLPSPMGDEIVLDGRDATNPLHIFRVPISRRMQHLADQLAQGTSSPIHYVERCMTYVDTFQLGVATDSTPDTAVIEQVGACGTFTSTLLALARCKGIHGRFVSLHNFPPRDGHTLCELRINGKWMLFDPTTHVCFVGDDLDQPLPLSYEELKDRLRTNSPFLRRGGNDRNGFELYSGEQIYRSAVPQGVIGPDLPMTFPLSLEMKTKQALSKREFGPVYQGADFIGAAATNQQQLWMLSNLIAGSVYSFTIELDWIGGDLGFKDRSFRLCHSIQGGEITANPAPNLDFAKKPVENWTLNFRASQPDVQLLLTHPYRGPDYRYFYPLEYRLRSLENLLS